MEIIILDVLVKIDSSICLAETGVPETISVTTHGHYSEQNGVYSLDYDEMTEDGESVTTVITVDGNLVSVERVGQPPGCLTIEQGRRHLSSYETGFGALMIGLYGEEIASRFDENGGEIHLHYTLDIESEYQGRNDLTVRFRGIG